MWETERDAEMLPLDTTGETWGERCHGTAPAGGRSPGRPQARTRVYHRLYAHLAWNTLQRLPLMRPSRARSVEYQLVACCWRLGMDPVAAVALPERVHLLFRYPATHCPAEIAVRLRAGATEAMAQRGERAPWSRSYALASVGPDEVDPLARVLRRARRRSRRASRTPLRGGSRWRFDGTSPPGLP